MNNVQLLKDLYLCMYRMRDCESQIIHKNLFGYINNSAPYQYNDSHIKDISSLTYNFNSSNETVLYSIRT